MWQGAVSIITPRAVVSPPRPCGPTFSLLIWVSKSCFKGGVETVGVVFCQRAKQGFFAQETGHLEIAAKADTYDKRRAGIRAGVFDHFDNPAAYFFDVGGGFEHFELALIFAAAAFGHDRDF